MVCGEDGLRIRLTASARAGFLASILSGGWDEWDWEAGAWASPRPVGPRCRELGVSPYARLGQLDLSDALPHFCNGTYTLIFWRPARSRLVAARAYGLEVRDGRAVGLQLRPDLT
jgi:hypothetical protein